jgi:hypothetical protein
MAASQQSRAPDQSANPAGSLAKKHPALGGAALSIRLWRAHGTGKAEELSWDSKNAAVCLALDLIAASKWVTSATHGRYLVAGFAGIEPALLTARRLQWAIQGFSDSDRFTGTAIAVLVHSAEDLPGLEPGNAALPPLERAAPGQTLLTPKTWELLRDLPGLPLQAASEPGLYELLWHGPEKAPSRTSDEEAISRFIKLHGLEIETPAPAQAPSSSSAPVLPGTKDLSGARDPGLFPAADSAERVRHDPGIVALLRRGNPRLLIGAACAVLIVLVIVTVAVSHKRTAISAASVVQPASSTAAPLPSGGLPPQPQPTNLAPLTAPGNRTEPAKRNVQTQNVQAQKDRSQGKSGQSDPTASDTTLSQLSKQKATGGKCDLDANLIPKALDQAEKSRDQGNYDAAVRQFRSVLACEPDNPRARSGLERVLFAKQTEK